MMKLHTHRPLLSAFLLLTLPGVAAVAGDWPQFRGPDRSGISSETGLLRSWPEAGPEVLWSTPVGQGYAAAAIHGGNVYFNDYDETTSEFLVRSLRLETGEERWRFREARRCSGVTCGWSRGRASRTSESETTREMGVGLVRAQTQR